MMDDLKVKLQPMRNIIGICAMIFLLQAPGFAEPDRAKSLSLSGVESYKQGRFESALGAFEASYKIDPREDTLFNAANSAIKLSLLAKSKELHQLYILRFPNSGRAKELAAQLKQLETRTVSPGEVRVPLTVGSKPSSDPAKLISVALNQLAVSCYVARRLGAKWTTMGTAQGLFLALLEDTHNCDPSHGWGCGCTNWSMFVPQADAEKKPNKRELESMQWSKRLFRAIVNRLHKDPAFRVQLVVDLTSFANRCDLDKEALRRVQNIRKVFDRGVEIYNKLKVKPEFSKCILKPNCNPRNFPKWAEEVVDDCYNEEERAWLKKSEPGLADEILKDECNPCFEGCNRQTKLIHEATQEYDAPLIAKDYNGYWGHYLIHRDLFIVEFILRRERQGVSIDEMRGLLTLAERLLGGVSSQ